MPFKNYFITELHKTIKKEKREQKLNKFLKELQRNHIVFYNDSKFYKLLFDFSF